VLIKIKHAMTETIRILYVTGNAAYADATATPLQDHDERFTVTTVQDASSAQDHLAATAVDCVVSAYALADQTGLALLRSTRETFPQLPFILFTDEGTETIASEAISSGVTDYITKDTATEQTPYLATRILIAIENYRTHRTLERQSDLFSKAQELANVGAWEYNPVEDTVHFSDEIYNIYGVEPTFEPDPEADIERFYHPDDRETVYAATKSALECGEAYDIEVRITAADGTEKWIRTRGKPEFVDGTCKRVRGTIQDITEQKTHERELREQKERLEEFASVVSHDLRNPLNIVSGRLEMVEKECDSEHFETINTALDRMERIISDVLWLAREGRDIGETHAVSLTQIAKQVWPMVSDISEQAELSITEPPNQDVIAADEDRLAQLLENLFRNTIDHGGPAVRVLFEVTDTGFAVSDDGPGIPDDEHEDIYTSGYSTEADGTGLGLSIVQQIVAAHGWEIHLTDSNEGGARFEISDVDWIR